MLLRMALLYLLAANPVAPMARRAFRIPAVSAAFAVIGPLGFWDVRRRGLPKVCSSGRSLFKSLSWLVQVWGLALRVQQIA